MTNYYRYEERYYIDDAMKVVLNEYIVISETKKGVWISDIYNSDIYNIKKRFIRNKSRKKFAYNTKEQAIDNFICRKNDK